MTHREPVHEPGAARTWEPEKYVKPDLMLAILDWVVQRETFTQRELRAFISGEEPEFSDGYAQSKASAACLWMARDGYATADGTRDDARCVIWTVT